jgi:hypothetical protein
VTFAYRRSDRSVVDPSRAVTDLVRATLALGPEARISAMQMSCGYPELGCGEDETQVTFTRSAPDGEAHGSDRLRIAKAMRDATADDVRAAFDNERRWRAALVR